MGTTPKALRQPPPRRFENYILTRSTASSVNLASVPDSLFTPCSPGVAEVGFQDPGVGYTDDGLSVLLDIGFNFQIDNITYKKFVVCTNGWMALVDPVLGTFASSQILNSAVWINSAIKTTFTANHVLLAPWFDDLRNVATDATSIYGTTKSDRINRGLETPPAPVNPTQNSVKFFRDDRSSRGRRLIVRWNSLSDYASPNTIIRFEVIIYENGTIEYRYSPRANINLAANASSPEDATIGIFMPGGVSRFRDFSYGLGYRDAERQQYRYGGTVFSSTYTDTADATTAAYTCNLKPFTHWPGLEASGGQFTFSPPFNRRRVLPRLESRKADSRLTLPTVARTGDPRQGNDPISFDDRRTLKYVSSGLSGSMTTGSVVNAPSMLQRFYGDSEPSAVARQDLFAGDFEFTASIVKAVVDQFIQGDIPRSIEPFSEYKLFENDPASATDSFFTSGSSRDALGDGLSQPLKAKTQIRLSLPVNLNCSLFGTASTIHYYNRRAGAWNVPQNATYQISNGGTTNDSGKARGDIVQSLVADSNNRRIIEDHRGFGPVGNVVSSGSHNKTGVGDQTDFSIGSPYSTTNVTIALSKQYNKSITVNEDYRASVDEVIRLPINQPFLIERAIIEVPFAAGNGWFLDKTTCLATHENTPAGFDFGGPALTVALFNQTIVGSLSRRDLIMTGTITHDLDNVNEIVFSAFPPITSTFQIRPRGFRAFGGPAGAVVTPASSSLVGYSFTGSVAVKCEAQVSNGIIARLELAMTSSDVQANKSGVIDVFNTSQITLGNQITGHYSQSCYIAYINNFGRAGSGFDPSGRSIFGKEFATSGELTAQGKVANPFYLTGTNGGAASPTFVGLPAQFAAGITGGSTFKFELALPLESYKASPYLVMPGDTLVLAISKTRPVFLGSQAPSPFTSGSIQHDVKLVTGAINIVLYGSMIREGKEFHDTLNQPLASDAIHEIVVGNEPVLDQFETSYRETYIGGVYDDYITGSLLTKVRKSDGRFGFVTGNFIQQAGDVFVSSGSRGRIFSRNDARNAPVDNITGFITASNPSWAQRLQPWAERVGSLRLAQHTDISERFWDSMMPAINQCFLANGAGIFMLRSPQTIGDISGQFGVVDQRIGWLWFDYQSPLWFPTWGKLLDGIWTKAFPFEPRYSQIPRQQFIEKSFIANYEVDFGGSYPYTTPGVYTIDPKPLTGFFFGSVGGGYDGRFGGAANAKPTVPWNGPRIEVPSFHNFLWASDIYFGVRGQSQLTNAGGHLTSSAGVADASRVLFGFGDLNNMITSSVGNNVTFGTNHHADFRQHIFDPTNWGNWFSFSPIIRGWKYGVYSGLPAFSKAYFRQGHFGQFRDMLEQRPFTKYYQSAENSPNIENFRQGTTPSAVSIKFVDAAGKLTKPENTWSQNLSFEATSSVPYFDGETRNRQPIITDTLNSNIIAFKANQFGQVTL